MTTDDGEDGREQLLGGRYRLGELLGVGGSASVYAAEDVEEPDPAGSPRRAAVKILHPHLSAAPEAREAFLREARAVQGVQHPNIAEVYASGVHEAGGVLLAWIALELVAGGSVADRVARRGPMGPGEAAAVLDGVLSALGAAHALGLVHRDVSPANVLLTAPAGPVRAEQVRLVDFGLADATGQAALGTDVLRAVPLAGAASRGVIGSADYMSPEQAQGRPVRAPGDLYQVGALGYFLLTGRPPYPRDTPAQVLAAHVSAPPPVPSALVPGARALDRVVTRAMAKAAARRYRDATEFRAALAAVVDALDVAGADGEPVPVAPTGESAPGPTRVLGPGGPSDLGYLEPDGPAAAGGPPVRSSAAASGMAGALAVVVVLAVAVWGVVSASAGTGPSGSPSMSVAASTAPSEPAGAPSAGDGSATAASTAPSAEPSSQESAPPVPPAPTSVPVPTLSGTLEDAELTLRAAGLVLGDVTRTGSPESLDRVLEQAPAPGQDVATGAAVDVTVASGANTVPPVGGLALAAATAALHSAGFTVVSDRTDPTVGPTSTVSGTQPAAGAILRVGTPVTVILDDPDPSPGPSPDPSSSAGPGDGT